MRQLCRGLFYDELGAVNSRPCLRLRLCWKPGFRDGPSDFKWHSSKFWRKWLCINWLYTFAQYNCLHFDANGTKSLGELLHSELVRVFAWRDKIRTAFDNSCPCEELSSQQWKGENLRSIRHIVTNSNRLGVYSQLQRRTFLLSEWASIENPVYSFSRSFFFVLISAVDILTVRLAFGYLRQV